MLTLIVSIVLIAIAIMVFFKQIHFSRLSKVYSNDTEKLLPIGECLLLSFGGYVLSSTLNSWSVWEQKFDGLERLSMKIAGPGDWMPVGSGVYENNVIIYAMENNNILHYELKTIPEIFSAEPKGVMS